MTCFVNLNHIVWQRYLHNVSRINFNSDYLYRQIKIQMTLQTLNSSRVEDECSGSSSSVRIGKFTFCKLKPLHCRCLKISNLNLNHFEIELSYWSEGLMTHLNAYSIDFEIILKFVLLRACYVFFLFLTDLLRYNYHTMKHTHFLGVAVHTCNPRTQEAEDRGSLWVWGYKVRSRSARSA